MHRKIEIIGNSNCLMEHLFSNLLVFKFCNMVEFSDSIVDYEALSLVIS